MTTRAWVTDEHAFIDPEVYARVWFNIPGDLMAITGKDGFEVVEAWSPTGNTVYEGDDKTFRRILIENKLRNELVIRFRRSS